MYKLYIAWFNGDATVQNWFDSENKMQLSKSRENLLLQIPRLTIRETKDNKNISCYANG